MTSQPCNGKGFVQTQKKVWTSQWSVILRTFYRQILSLLYSSFFFWNFRHRLARELLVHILLACSLPTTFHLYQCTIRVGTPRIEHLPRWNEWVWAIVDLTHIHVCVQSLECQVIFHCPGSHCDILVGGFLGQSCKQHCVRVGNPGSCCGFTIYACRFSHRCPVSWGFAEAFYSPCPDVANKDLEIHKPRW